MSQISSETYGLNEHVSRYVRASKLKENVLACLKFRDWTTVPALWGFKRKSPSLVTNHPKYSSKMTFYLDCKYEYCTATKIERTNKGAVVRCALLKCQKFVHRRMLTELSWLAVGTYFVQVYCPQTFVKWLKWSYVLCHASYVPSAECWHPYIMYANVMAMNCRNKIELSKLVTTVSLPK